MSKLSSKIMLEYHFRNLFINLALVLVSITLFPMSSLS